MEMLSQRALVKNPRLASTEETSVLRFWSNKKTFDKNIIDISLSLTKPEKWVIRTILSYWRYNLVPRGVFSSNNRNKKREIYQQFLNLVKNYITNIEYLGLTGANLPYTYEEYYKLGLFEFTVLEKSTITKQYTNFLYPEYSFYNPLINFRSGDIIEYLSKHDYYNVIDLDLMCHLSEDLIDKIIRPLWITPTALAINTSYGHGLTKDRYMNELRPYLYMKLQEKFHIQERISSNYCDRRVPMFSEYFILTKK